MWTVVIMLLTATVACAVDEPDADPTAVCDGKCDGASPLYNRRFYEDVALDAGLVPGSAPIVIGLRGVSREGNHHPPSTRPEFDDVIAVLRGDGSVIELPASTHPWFATSTMAPDVNGDGVRDVGMIRPGRYRAEPRPSSRDLAGAPTFHITTVDGADKLPGWRDTNHDGVYDQSERDASERRGDALGAVLFHRGGGTAPPAIGCQVFGAADIVKFVDAVGGRTAYIDYVLIEIP